MRYLINILFDRYFHECGNRGSFAITPEPINNQIIHDCLLNFNSSVSAYKACASCGILNTDNKNCNLDPLIIELFTWSVQNYFLNNHCTPVTFVDYSNKKLALYHEGVDVEKLLIHLCSLCHNSVNNNKIPQYSMINGFDWGNPENLKLPVLTELENSIIARMYLYINVLKINGTTNNQSQVAIHGHIISLKQDGPIQIAKALPITNLSTTMSVTYIGSKTSFDKQRNNILNKYLTVRVSAVYAWLNAKKTYDPGYANIIILDQNESIERELNSIGTILLDNATIIDNNMEIDKDIVQTNDIACIRPSSPNDNYDVDILEATYLKCDNQSNNNNVTLENIITSITENFVPESKLLHNSEILHASRQDQPIQIHIESQPINEMEHNDEIFAGSFPTSFFFLHR